MFVSLLGRVEPKCQRTIVLFWYVDKNIVFSMLVNFYDFKRCIHPNCLNISLFMFCCIRPLTSLFVKRCQVISLIYNFFCVMTFYKYLISVRRWLSSFTVYDSNLNPVLHNKIIELPRLIWKLCYFEWQQRHRFVRWNHPHQLQAAVVWNSNVLIGIRIADLPLNCVSGYKSRPAFFFSGFQNANKN
jgi:hypothetical protein